MGGRASFHPTHVGFLLNQSVLWDPRVPQLRVYRSGILSGHQGWHQIHGGFSTDLDDPGVIFDLFSQENMNTKRRQASDASFRREVQFCRGEFRQEETGRCMVSLGPFWMILGLFLTYFRRRTRIRRGDRHPTRRSDAMFRFVWGVQAGRDSSLHSEFLTVLGDPGVVPHLFLQENTNPKRRQASDASFRCNVQFCGRGLCRKRQLMAW